MPSKRTPEEIVKILHSISEIRVTNEDTEVFFDDSPIAESISGFERGSFTRQLLEFIEEYLTDDAGVA